MRSRFLAVTGACAAGAGALAYVAYRNDIKAARQQIEARGQFIDSPDGPIEFAESGDGPAVLLIHGAGGGFDQGLDLGAAFLGDGYRVIAPSRFGYLGTPLPAERRRGGGSSGSGCGRGARSTRRIRRRRRRRGRWRR